MDVVEHQVFRVTRNADLEVEEDRDEDLLQALERELARRRFGPPVRLEVTDTTSERVLDLLLTELDVDPADAVEVPGLLDLSSLWQLYGLDKPALKDPPFVPATNPAFAEGETPEERLRHAARRRCAAAPPVRVVRDHGAAVHRAGRRRPAGAGDQADAVPHLGRLPHRRRADLGGRGRQAGGRAGGDQGPVRRAGQHLLGQGAGTRRRARGLRPGRASRRTARPPWSSARRARPCAATAISAPATTTPRPPASTRISAC